MSRRSRLFVSTQVKDWGQSPLSRVPNTDLTVNVEYLVIAGGGGGGTKWAGGGGGAGGYLASTLTGVTLGSSYTITVGGGITLRNVAFGEGTALSFIVVTTITLGVLMIGARLLVGRLLKKR